MSLSVQFGALRTRELRELLQEEDRINLIVRRSDKVQRLQRAAEKMLLSNQKLAKVALSQKPQLRDAKLLLAIKYKEVDKLRSLIQAKQEQLAETHSLHGAQWSLLKKINHRDEDCELLFQRFAEGKTPLADFLDSFLSSRKLQHVRLVLVKKLQEMIELESTQTLCDGESSCLPACSLTTAVVLPACCLPPLLLPITAHVNTGPSLQHLSLRYDYNEHRGAHGRVTKWPARPVRLQPLKTQRGHQQKPQ